MRGAHGQFGRRRWTQAWGQVGRSNKNLPALCFSFVLACYTLSSTSGKAESRAAGSLLMQPFCFFSPSLLRQLCLSYSNLRDAAPVAVYQVVTFTALIITATFSFTLL